VELLFASALLKAFDTLLKMIVNFDFAS